MKLPTSLLPVLAIALAAGAQAQGDLCSSATSITNIGSFAFDTSALTTSGFDGGGGCSTGAAQVNQDGFWQWTAPAAGDYLFDTFGSTYDTKLSVHLGVGCAATCADYNDDTFGLQSEVQLAGLAAGDMVLIQVGGWGSESGTGTLNVQTYVDPCASSTDDSYEDNDTCATAIAIAPGVYSDLFASTTDKDFFSVTVQSGELLTVARLDSSFDIDFNVFGAACGTPTFHFDSWTYANTSAVTEDVIFEVISDPTNPQSCTDYDIEVSVGPDPCASADDSFEDNDSCASAVTIFDGSYPSLWASSGDGDFYSLCVSEGSTLSVDILFTDALANLNLYFWDAAAVGCGDTLGGNYLLAGNTTTDDESLTWTNNTGAGINIIVEVDVNANNACNTYDMIVVGAEDCNNLSSGSSFCPGNVNSLGAETLLKGYMNSVVGSGLHLEVTDGVPGQFGYVLVGNQATIGIPVSNGTLCLLGDPGAQLFRYNVAGGDSDSIGQFDVSGVLQNLAGTSNVGSGFDVPNTIPDVVPVGIMAGDTWHFQLWHRDTPAGTSNFSNGLSISF